VFALFGRVAAAAAVFACAWLALLDAAPALARSASVETVRTVVSPFLQEVAPAREILRERTPEAPAPGAALGALACGALLLAIGAWLARRWRTAPASGGGGA
jgi:hypothetical protein